ncbi:MAG: diguanylate cyclase [Proteobacteria bacterium]|nr:diguanylate cyclase [Pseudomonadota bacterium]
MALLLIAIPAGARANDGPVRLEEHCRIAADANTDLRIIAERLGRCDTPASKGYYGTIWVDYSQPPVRMIPKTWRMIFDNHPVQGLDLWLIDKAGKTQHVAYAPNAPDREWSAGNYFSLLVTPRQDVDRIVLRLTGSESHQYIRAPKIARAKDFAPIERDQAALYGIGVGMLALTVLFHLNLFFAMRRRFQLIYCAHVALLFAYALCYSGVVRIGLPMLGAGAISKLLTFSMTAATATGTAFVVEFLGLSMPRWARRWAAVAAGISLVAAVLVTISPSAIAFYAAQLANLAALHAILVTAGILAAACIRRLPLAGTVALGWVVPILVSLMYPARAFGLIGDASLPDGLLLLSVTVECLILSLPVTARIRNLRIDHERAQERHMMLERQAQTDVLTGLANRRGFNDALARAAAAHAEPMPLAMLVIDIDHFKRVNDQHGHAAGDQILRHVAMHVAKVSGAGAIVSRYGGEEFLVALRGHDLMRAGTIAERIRCSIGVTFEAETELPPVTVSIGVAAGFSDDVETMIGDADCALYRAKNEGRNRVMLADGPIVYSAAA